MILTSFYDTEKYFIVDFLVISRLPIFSKDVVLELFPNINLLQSAENVQNESSLGISA